MILLGIFCSFCFKYFTLGTSVHLSFLFRPYGRIGYILYNLKIFKDALISLLINLLDLLERQQSKPLTDLIDPTLLKSMLTLSSIVLVGV